MYVLHRFGPLRHHWCMRFESKNAQIKRFLSLQSYRNVPLSVSIHHQMWMCYQLLTQPEQSTSNFLYIVIADSVSMMESIRMKVRTGYERAPVTAHHGGPLTYIVGLFFIRPYTVHPPLLYAMSPPQSAMIPLSHTI